MMRTRRVATIVVVALGILSVAGCSEPTQGPPPVETSTVTPFPEPAATSPPPSLLPTPTPVATSTMPPVPGPSGTGAPAPLSTPAAMTPLVSSPQPTAAPGPVLAPGPSLSTLEDDFDVRASEAILQLPDSVSFHLEGSGARRIETIDVEFGTNHVFSCASTSYWSARTDWSAPADFEAGDEVVVSWEWDMRRSGSQPPGALIWWR